MAGVRDTLLFWNATAPVQYALEAVSELRVSWRTISLIGYQIETQVAMTLIRESTLR